MVGEFHRGVDLVRNGSPLEAFLRRPRLLHGKSWQQIIQVQFWTANDSTPDAFEIWKEEVESHVPEMMKAIQDIHGDACPISVTFETPRMNGHLHCGCIFIGVRNVTRSIDWNQLGSPNKRIFALKEQRGETMAYSLTRHEFFVMVNRAPYRSQLVPEV
jgi:hypothetical protein